MQVRWTWVEWRGVKGEARERLRMGKEVRGVRGVKCKVLRRREDSQPRRITPGCSHASVTDAHSLSSMKSWLSPCDIHAHCLAFIHLTMTFASLHLLIPPSLPSAQPLTSSSLPLYHCPIWALPEHAIEEGTCGRKSSHSMSSHLLGTAFQAGALFFLSARDEMKGTVLCMMLQFAR